MMKPEVDEAITIVHTADGVASHLDVPAGSSLQALYEHAACPRLLQRTLSGPISWQQRVEITVAQVLLSPGLAPGWIAALLVLDARAVLGNSGTEEGLLSTLLPGRGLRGRQLHSLHVPTDRGLRWGEAHVARMPSDRPMIGAVAVVEMNNGLVRHARLALTGVWREHARLAEAAGLLASHPLEREQIEGVAQAVGKEVAPVGDFLASAVYRQAMAVVLTRRVFHQCQQEEGVSKG
jgi:CO/xanthine dehydrogenase FAD-binding subunit